MEQKLIQALASPPKSWLYCFLGQCSKARECVRFQSGKVVNNECKQGRAVFPTALNGTGCPFFMPIRKVRVAWGFTRLFDGVRHEDYKQLRSDVYKLAGGRRNYYRYDKGERTISPELQQAFSNLFKSYGYTGSIVFDNYEDTYRLE